MLPTKGTTIIFGSGRPDEEWRGGGGKKIRAPWGGGGGGEINLPTSNEGRMIKINLSVMAKMKIILMG